MTIAEQIKKSIDAVTDWEHWTTTTYAIAFKKANPDILDRVITKHAKAGSWLNVARTKIRAEASGYSSKTIDEKTKLFLTNIPFFTAGKLPYTNPGDTTNPFYNWYHSVLEGYRWAIELTHEIDRWDAKSGFDALKTFREGQKQAYYACNIDTNTVKRLYGGRWHQLGALCGVWRRFGEVGIGDALDMMEKEWIFLNDNYWKETHYIYAPDWKDWEMRFPNVFKEFLRLWKLDPAIRHHGRIF